MTRYYEYVHDGCATEWGECPRVDPVTVHRLDAQGRRRPGGTVCIERDELDAERGPWIGKAQP